MFDILGCYLLSPRSQTYYYCGLRILQQRPRVSPRPPVRTFDLLPNKILQPNPDLDESMNFDEMILEAAKSIAAATSTLVKAASAAQRELIDSGKVSRTPLTSSDDGQWSEGLISAARLVAAATHSLVESANALVQGKIQLEKWFRLVSWWNCTGVRRSGKVQGWPVTFSSEIFGIRERLRGNLFIFEIPHLRCVFKEFSERG